MTEIATDSTPAGHLRALLVERLKTQGQIRTPGVAAAFWRVPREAFVPAGTSLEDAYRDDVVVTKRRPEDGRASSSVSAPWLSLSSLIVLQWHRRRRGRPGSPSWAYLDQTADEILERLASYLQRIPHRSTSTSRSGKRTGASTPATASIRPLSSAPLVHQPSG